MGSTSERDAREIVRRRVVYHGRVQGVGFRMTAASIARGFEVVGFVRNLPDGTVELEAEGIPQQVDSLLSAIQTQFREHLRDSASALAAPKANEDEFRILY